MAKYRVKPPFDTMPFLRTVLANGKVVGINQAHKKQQRAKPGLPAREVDIPKATEQELGELFRRGEKYIEEVKEPETFAQKPEKQAKTDKDDE